MTPAEAYVHGIAFGQRSKGLPMGSQERRKLCTETEAFMATVPAEWMADFLDGLTRGMAKAVLPLPVKTYEHFLFDRIAGAGRSESHQPTQRCSSTGPGRAESHNEDEEKARAHA